MDHEFLYDPARHLFSIGYNVDDHRRDSGNYDLLASEARLTSFVAVARGQVPQESWFALGRQLASVDGKTVLLSWSGSMFEYLMPMLVMPSYPHTLLDQTCRGAVQRQIDYGAERGVPWGVSESAFNFVDRQNQYQYKAFGVPGLGLKRGLADHLVVAPYATALAVLIDPRAAAENLRALSRLGLEGRLGDYDAIDFTEAGRVDVASSDVSPRADGGVVVPLHGHPRACRWSRSARRCWARRRAIRSRPLPRRPANQATESLQERAEERADHATAAAVGESDRRSSRPRRAAAGRRTRSIRRRTSSRTAPTTVVTNSGGGASAVPRERGRAGGGPDARRQPAIYLRDVRSGASGRPRTSRPVANGVLPGHVPPRSRVVPAHGRQRRDAARIAVSPEGDVECAGSP
jgi:hypothetical protein